MADILTLGLGVDTSQATRQINAWASKFPPVNLKFNANTGGLNGISQSLGHIERSAIQFNKSLEASTARVLAFGATVGVVYSVQRAFRGMITDAINVEKELVKVNSILKLSGESFRQFSNGVFQAARQTGQSFEEAAEAAEELAKQGLGASETMKRLNSALISLSGLSGVSGKEAVQELTSALNSFQKQVLSSGDVVNKFSAISQNFAISEADLSTAFQRVGSSAEDAGVNFDHLAALVTSLKQTTQRDGAVIGDALKSIFTRLQRSDTIQELESLGVAMKNLDGTARDATSVLKDLSAVYPTLSINQKAYVTEISSGLFQVNQFKAALNDLGKEYSVYSRALETSSNATDEAIKRNEKLNTTFAAQINVLKLAGQQAGAQLGTEVLKKPLGQVQLAAKEFIGLDDTGNVDGNSIGLKLGTGIAKGIGAALSGPAGIAILTIVGALFKRTTAYAFEAAKSLVPLTGAEKERLLISNNIEKTLQAQGKTYNQLIAGATTLAEVHERVLNAVRQTAGQNVLHQSQIYSAAGAVQGEFGANEQGLYSKGGSSSLLNRSSLRDAGAAAYRAKESAIDTAYNVGESALKTGVKLFPPGGGPPNFADPLREAFDREKASGVPESSIYVDKDSRLKSIDNPLGLLVANKIDEPLGGWQGVNRALGAGKNLSKNIPNYADIGSGPSGYSYNDYGDSQINPNQKTKDVFGKTYTQGELPTAQKYKDDEIAAEQARITNALQKYRVGIESKTALGKVEAKDALNSIGYTKGFRDKLAATIKDEIKSAEQSAKAAAKQAKIQEDINAPLTQEELLYRKIVQIKTQGVDIRGFAPGQKRPTPANEQQPFPEVVTSSGLQFPEGVDPAVTISQGRSQSSELTNKIKRALFNEQRANQLKSVQDTISNGGQLSDEQIQSIRRQGTIFARSHPALKGLSQQDIYENDEASNLFTRLKKDYVGTQLGAARQSQVQSVIGSVFSQNQGSLFRKESDDLRDVEAKLGKLSAEEKEMKFGPAAAQAKGARRQALQGTALNAAILASIATGFIPEGRTNDIVQGGATGLSIGALGASVSPALANPYVLGGAAVVGGAGAAISYETKGPERKLKELSDKFETLNSSIKNNVDSTSNYIKAQQQLNDLIASGDAKESDIESLNVQLSGFFNAITDDTTKRGIIGAGNDIDKLNISLGELAKVSSKLVANNSVAVFAQQALKNSSNGISDAIFGGRDITNADIGSLSGAISSSLKPEDLDKLKGLYSGASHDAGGLKNAFKGLGLGTENEEAFNKIADKDLSAGFLALSEAIDKLKESVERAKEATEDNKLAVNLSKLDRQFSQLATIAQGARETSDIQSSTANKGKIAGFNQAFELQSLGLNEKSILGIRGQIEKSSLLEEQNAAQRQIKTGLAGELTTFAQGKFNIDSNSLRNILGDIGKKEPDEVLKNLITSFSSYRGDLKADDDGKTGSTLETMLTSFQEKLNKSNIEFNSKQSIQQGQTDTELKILLQKNLAAGFGGAGLNSKPLDFTEVGLGVKAGVFRELGENILNSSNLYTPGNGNSPTGGIIGRNTRKEQLTSQTQGFRETESQALLNRIAYLGPELGERLANDPANVALITKTKYEENRQKLNSDTKNQIGTFFQTEFSLGSERGGLSKAGQAGNLYNALQRSVKENGGQVNYEQLSGIIDNYKKNVFGNNSPAINRLSGIVSGAGQDYSRLGAVSASQAQELIKTNGTADPGLLALIKGFEGSKIEVNTAKTAQATEALLDIFDQQRGVSAAERTTAELNKEKQGYEANRNAAIQAKASIIGSQTIEPYSLAPYDPISFDNYNTGVKIGKGKPTIIDELNAFRGGRKDLNPNADIGSVSNLGGINKAINGGGDVNQIYSKIYGDEKSFRELSQLLGGDENVKKFIAYTGNKNLDTSTQDNAISVNNQKANALDPKIKAAQDNEKKLEESFKNNSTALINGASQAGDIFTKKLEDSFKNLHLMATQTVNAEVKVIWDKLKIKVNDIDGFAETVTSMIKSALENKGTSNSLPRPPANIPAASN